ncbi:MAG: sensor histidine kinase [Mangrovibacterium sp.]
MRIFFQSNKQLTVALHLLAWAFVVIIPQYYLLRVYGGGRDSHFMWQFYVNTLLYGVVFYLNYLWLVPRLFFRERKLSYVFGVGLTILLACLLLYLINDCLFFDQEREQLMDRIMKQLNPGGEVHKPPRQLRVFNYFYSSLLICGFSLGLGVLEKLGQNEKQRKDLEKEMLNSELAFLKNQVSPHFFFNTLNNIYSLIGYDAEEARQAVLRLSKLMRYMLYESEQGGTRLRDEVSFLNNYIDLMKLRLSEKVRLTVVMPDNMPDMLIPPLLFVPFVENAFKHGISYRERSFIEIRMEVNAGQIRFIARNSMNPGTHTGDSHSGIGLENVKKRLFLLFPDTHKLIIREAGAEYDVELLLDVHPLTRYDHD